MVESRGPATFGVTLALIIVATVFVGARFFTRGYIVRSIKNDDWWILAAWICSVGFSIAICVAVSDGLGKHNTDIPYAEKDNLRRAQYTFSILYNPCLMLTKTSIIVFYLSVMSEDVDPVFKWCNWITLALTNITGTALTFLNIFQCRPISAGYEYPGPPNPKCTDIVTLYLSSAPVNIITDLALLLLPMPILTGLRLPKKQKIILIVTFSAGAFVAVVDVIRIAYLQEAAISRLSVKTDGGTATGRIVESTDFTWYASLSFMWSAIEVNIGLICACVPSLKPLFLKFAPSFIKDDSDDITPMGSFDAGEKPNLVLSTDQADTNILTNPAAFRRPTVKEYSGEDDGDEMGFLNMLSGPDYDAPVAKTSSSNSRKSTNTNSNTNRRALSKTSTNLSTKSDFGFVQMDKNKNMLKLSNRQSLWAVAVVTIIFFMWGFARGLLDVLNGQFQYITNLTDGEALGLHGVYYAGYFVGPLTLGRFMLHRYGFKSTMMAGLCIYGSGTLVFWPAAVLTSYPAFLVSNFIVGFGLSLLEVAANPYIALCGPLEYAEVRLNFSQAFQAIGQICSPLLAQRVLFKNILTGPSLVNVQWTYLGISLFDFALAIVFYYIPLPEATAEQLEEQADKRSAVYRTRIGSMRVVWVTLIMGVFGQFCYVGAQEGNGGNAEPLVNLLRRPGMPSASDFSALNATTFAVGRFLGAFLNYLVKPRWILMACFLGIISITASQLHADGAGGIAAVNLGYLFEGSIFPIIFAISMRGMGDQTFNAAAYMTASICSGALIPPMVWAVKNAHGLRYSYSVMLGVLCFGALFPIYLNFVPAAKNQVDPIHENRDRRRRTRKADRANRQNSTFSASSAGADVLPEKEFGLMGILARKKRDHEKHVSGVSFMPQSQHVERSSSIQTDSPISPKQNANPWNDNAWDGLDAPEPAHTKSAGSNVAVLSSWTGSTSSDEEKNSTEKRDFGDSIQTTGDGPDNIRRSSTASSENDVQVYEARKTGHQRKPRHMSSVDEETEMSGGSGEDLAPITTQQTRDWTEEDDVRDDYHRILRGL